MIKKNVLFVMLAALLLAACAPAASQVVVPAPGAPTTGVTVSGRGQVYLEPNIAYVTIGVRTSGTNVSDVVAANATQVSAVMEALSGLGVAKEDMQTSNFNVYASDGYDPSTGMPTGTTNYSVENTVNVTARDLAALGDLLDRAVSAGANSIWGVSFDVDDKNPSQAEARDLAIADAIAEAQAVAAAAGVTLGEIVNITYTDTAGMYYPMYGMGGGGGAMTDSAATSIVPGRISISADVAITFAIK